MGAAAAPAASPAAGVSATGSAAASGGAASSGDTAIVGAYGADALKKSIDDMVWDLADD